MNDDLDNQEPLFDFSKGSRNRVNVEVPHVMAYPREEKESNKPKELSDGEIYRQGGRTNALGGRSFIDRLKADYRLAKVDVSTDNALASLKSMDLFFKESSDDLSPEVSEYIRPLKDMTAGELRDYLNPPGLPTRCFRKLLSIAYKLRKLFIDEIKTISALIKLRRGK